VLALILAATQASFADSMTITSLWDYTRPADSALRFRTALADARGR
jgi:hypothetical protein